MIMDAELKRKLKKLTKGEVSPALEKARKRKANRTWLRKSSTIANEILEFLRVNKWTQKEFASRMDVSPQYLTKLLRGQENLTLETMTKINKAMGYEMIEINVVDSLQAQEKKFLDFMKKKTFTSNEFSLSLNHESSYNLSSLKREMIKYYTVYSDTVQSYGEEERVTSHLMRNAS